MGNHRQARSIEHQNGTGLSGVSLGTQFIPLDLSRRSRWQGRYEFDPVGIFIARPMGLHMRLQPGAHVIEVGRGIAKHHKGFRLDQACLA